MIGGVVELVVGEKVFRALRPSLNEILAAPGEPRVMLARITQHAARSMVAARLVAWPDEERAGFAVWRDRVADVRILAHRRVLTASKRNSITPLAGLVGNEVYAPFVARRRTRFSGIAVGCEIAGDLIALLALRKRHIQAIVEKRIRLRAFARFRTVERQHDVMPLLELAADSRACGGGARGGNNGENEQEREMTHGDIFLGPYFHRISRRRSRLPRRPGDSQHEGSGLRGRYK